MKTEGEAESSQEVKFFFSFFLSLVINIYLAFYLFEVKTKNTELKESFKTIYTINVLQEQIIEEQEVLIKLYERKSLFKAQDYAQKN